MLLLMSSRAALLPLAVIAASAILCLGLMSSARSSDKPRTAKDARLCVTGYDHNRPDSFPGLGDFIGWAEAIERMPNGDILLVHSAGYWHASYASPRLIEPQLTDRWATRGWPVDFPAPTGGRSMACRSTDEGKTWSRPVTVYDHRLDDRPDGLLTCRDNTVLCFVNVQASWAGYAQAPEAFRSDLDGLNTKQCVLRSTDSGRTWSEPIWIEPPEGARYERAHGRPIQLPDGGILWATYCDSATGLFGAIHRSDDSGKTWRVISVIRRPSGKPLDEPAIVRLHDGRLLMVARPDGGVLYSKDEGVSWEETATLLVEGGTFYAPQLLVLRDGTVIAVAGWKNLRVWLSRDSGAAWSSDIPLDASCYGYPGVLMLDDESFLVSYCESAYAPNRVYVMRVRANESRTGIELPPIGADSAQ